MTPRVALALACLCSAPAWAQESEPPSGPVGDLLDIPGGRLFQGDPKGDENEVQRTLEVAGFRLMRHEVTNRMFAAFVAESGHRSDPERNDFGYVWDGEWQKVAGANWRRPKGPESDLNGLDDHPVIQVSQRDAAAFCAYYGLRLPSEIEWEYAARGTDRRRFPWGDEPPEATDGSRRANFGSVPCCAPDRSDGFQLTAPVGSFPSGASPFGLLDMAGNVWEWTADSFPGQPEKVSLRGGGWGNNPYCLRVSYRHGNPPDIGLDMVGFRCAADAAE